MRSIFTQTAASLAVFALLAGCGGAGSSGKDNPFQSDPEPDPAPINNAIAAPDGTGDPTSFTADDDGDGIPNAEESDGDADANRIRNSLQGDVTSVALGVGGTTLDVQIAGLDGTPMSATYARQPSLDVDGALLNTLYPADPGDPPSFDDTRTYYFAYSLQEDALDRLFVALGNTSQDGAVRGDHIHSGNQFNEFFAGGLYARAGTFDPPNTVSAGPGTGQVSYDGIYAATSNLGATDGQTLIDPTTTQPNEVLPRENARIVGKIFLNANFVDNQVNGVIFDRILIDPELSDGSSAENRELPSIVLAATGIDADGRFFGDVNFSQAQSSSNPDFQGLNFETDIGDYGGIFGGTDANSVAGLTRVESLNLDPSNTATEIEHGVFVLTQCGRNGDETRCDEVAP